jgi:polysaccharide biosynthesis protein PslA
MTTLVSLPGSQDNVASFWKSYRPKLAASGSRHSGRGRYAPRVSGAGAPLSLTKRVVDMTGASFGLLFLLPILIAIAIAIKATSRGPVFFRQYRYGYRNRLFKIYKFRTMYQARGDASGRKQTVAGDSRITPLGRILRNTSLDEIPQLINVLKGDMSLVGPRPPIAYEVEKYRAWHRRRVLEAKPGMTGLWQVTGRSRTTFDEMVRLDLQYARTRSLWFDLRILLATPRAVITGKGAS